MYPLVYHLGIDDYFPNEDFEPHLFEHVAAWRRESRRPSMVRRVGSTLMRLIRGREDRCVEGPSATQSTIGGPAFHWG